jgi:hypothetical protein
MFLLGALVMDHLQRQGPAHVILQLEYCDSVSSVRRGGPSLLKHVKDILQREDRKTCLKYCTRGATCRCIALAQSMSEEKESFYIQMTTRQKLERGNARSSFGFYSSLQGTVGCRIVGLKLPALQQIALNRSTLGGDVFLEIRQEEDCARDAQSSLKEYEVHSVWEIKDTS